MLVWELDIQGGSNLYSLPSIGFYTIPITMDFLSATEVLVPRRFTFPKYIYSNKYFNQWSFRKSILNITRSNLKNAKYNNSGNFPK